MSFRTGGSEGYLSTVWTKKLPFYDGPRGQQGSVARSDDERK